MIDDPFTYIAVLAALGGLLTWLEQRSTGRVFAFVPPIVILYFGVMLLGTAGLWPAPGENAAIDAAYRAVRDNVLPAMIFLMLLKSDLRQIGKLGGRMLLAFFTASSSIAIGFVIAFTLFHPLLADDAWKTFAALAGSWMGGTGNMAAIQAALEVPDSSMGYTLLIDSIDYALWVVFLLALVPYAARFNRWTRADTSLIDRVGGRLEAGAKTAKLPITGSDLLLLTGLALLLSALVRSAADGLPTSDFLTTMTWVVLLVTVLGVAAALTPLGRTPGSAELASVMLYLIVAVIASRANFTALTEAPAYIVAGLVILAAHGAIMAAVGKLFRLDLFSLGVASLANIGGIASAPILAAAYSRVLIPIGVLMAMLGYIVGTAGGLLVGRVLSLLAA